MDNEKIKFAVIGCGHIGKRHAAVIERNEFAELVALCDVKEKETLNLDNYNIPFFNSIDDLLAGEIDFDVMCVATPNGLHEEHALKGLRAGRHVVIEKPMTLTKRGCENIIHESLKQHRHVFCVMQNRYSPPSVWLKEIIGQNILGKIYMVHVNCYWNRDERYYVKDSWHGSKKLDGGVLFTQFSHYIDILFWLFGDIENISSRTINFNHKHLTEFEDSGFVNFDFVNGGTGCINYSTSVWEENLETSLTIIAENGSVKVGGQYMNEVEVCNIKGYTMPELALSAPPNDYGAYKGSAANHHFFFENVVKVLQGSDHITTNALEGMKVVEMIERINKAANKRK